MPTKKQKDAVKILSENIGKPIGEAMREAGYSKSTSETPQRLTESKGFQQLMDEYLPDELLAEKHKELLTTPKKVRHYVKGDLESEYEELDTQAVSKGLDMAYKLKGSYAPEKKEIKGTISLTDLFSKSKEQ